MIQHFSGVLTEADHKGHVPITFDVPQGTARIAVRFDATPQRSAGQMFDNMISLSLFAPDGARGQRHNNPVWDFWVEGDHASPGYLPGPITPGQWTVFMDVFRLLGPDPVQWSLDIACDPVAPERPAAPQPGQTASRGPGWYRGDLHAHTIHSDGSWDIPDLVGWARGHALDFMTISDHNTPSSHAGAMALADDALLVMGGIELTTHYGHALSLGRRDWQEWRSGPVSGKTMPMIARDVMASGALFVIAHPMAPGDDAGCTGCRWDYTYMRPGPAGIVEIWNGGVWSDYNEAGLALYRSWLAAGHRLVATAGTDIHGPFDANLPVGFNNVQADDLTEAAVLAAVRAGRNYLSSGPRLVLTGAGDVPMGGTVAAGAAISAEWDVQDTPLTLGFHGAAGLLASHDPPPNTSGRTALAAAPAGFVMAELRDGNGVLHAVTNPIFVS